MCVFNDLINSLNPSSVESLNTFVEYFYTPFFFYLI